MFSAENEKAYTYMRQLLAVRAIALRARVQIFKKPLEIGLAAGFYSKNKKLRNCVRMKAMQGGFEFVEFIHRGFDDEQNLRSAFDEPCQR